MQVTITGKGIELTEAIKAYAEEKIGALDKFYDGIIRAEMAVGVENHHHLKGQIYVADCKLIVPGKDLFASKNEKTLYKAIDKIRDYLEGELKKMKAKRRASRESGKAKNFKRTAKEYKIEE